MVARAALWLNAKDPKNPAKRPDQLQIGATLAASWALCWGIGMFSTTVRDVRVLVALALAIVAAEVPAESVVTKDLAYVDDMRASTDAHRLDVYAPAEAANAPMLLFVHGGGWARGDKRAVDLKPDYFNEAGFVFASTNYRLIPERSTESDTPERIEPGIPDYAVQAGDIAAAVAYLHRHAADCGGDPDRIFLMGHSAGAHLVALVGTDPKYLRDAGLGLDSLSGVVVLDTGGLDIERQITELGGPRNRGLYRTVFGEDATHWADASPVRHVREGTDIPPFLIVYVGRRRDTRSQAEGMARALNGAGVSAETYAAEGKTHRTLNREMGKAGDAPSIRILEFFNKYRE